jgi:lipopolysaccharide/colanic/teichoic acid biosynthesis glycosyltransferase
VTQGSIAISLLQTEFRAQPENTVLVVGDDRIRDLVDVAWRRSGRSVAAFDPDAFLPLGTGHDLVVQAAALDHVRQGHPHVLHGARRVWVVPDEAGGGPTSSPFANPLPLGGRLVKRALDVTVALVGLVLALPVALVAMVAVRLDSPGPALFRQIRMGANGRRFRLYKLRTMQHGNDDRAHREYVAKLITGRGERCEDVYKLVHDPRITRVGRLLRNWSIDELPQLWNVVRGDMSLVGPRPPLPHEAELYPARAWGRLRVKPGITGLWQVSGRCELSFDDMVSMDVRYWQRWSILSDLRILLETPGAVLSRRGAG